MKKLVAIDGNSIMNRAFYGVMNSKLLVTTDGLYTNAIFGFVNILLKLINEEKPDYICVAFDLKSPTFRHKMYEEYKGTRKGMPDELRMQMPVIKDVLRAMNIAICELEGYEADDIIGTLSKMAEKEDVQALLITGDRDYLQLVNDKVMVRIPSTKMGNTEYKDYTPEVVREVYGIEPIEFIQIKGLMGDGSDNIPGVPGVGEKTAFSLIKTYHTLDTIYEKLATGEEVEGIKGKLKEKIEQNKELAFLSRDLGKICLEVPLDFTLEDLVKQEVNQDELFQLFARLQFKTFIERMGLTEGKDNVKKTVIPELVVKEWQEADIEHAKEIAYYWDKHLAICIDQVVYYQETPTTEDLKKMFESQSLKIGNDVKKDYVSLLSQEITPNNLQFDLSIASYLLNPAKDNYRLDEMILENLGVMMDTKKENEQIGLFDQVGTSKEEKERACQYALYIALCKENYEQALKEKNQDKLFTEIEMPLVKVLATMEMAGVLVDRNMMEEFSIKLNREVESLTKEIYQIADGDFNINSTKQLGEVLFEKLKLPVIKKTKNGYSTDAEVLEKLREDHPIVDKILEYRNLNKLKTTYIDGLIPLIQEDGRIHAKFNQTVTATGRISCTEPNLQNIPIRTELGREMRKLFVAQEGYIFLDADYSQIELRVLAHMAHDERMIAGFKAGEDIHTITASQVFGVPMGEVTKEMRSDAKAVNFGIVYGISDYGLGSNLGIGRYLAKEYIEKYFKTYAGIKRYMDDVVKKCKEMGYVETLWGRRRYVPEIKSSNFNVRHFGERVAMNAPIQGTAADIIKIAMIHVAQELEEKHLQSRLILQVHDELLVETKIEEVEQVKELLIRNMENVLSMEVPLVVDCKEGKNWFEAH